MVVSGGGEAWRILERYAVECSRIGAEILMTVFAIGSLSGEYYQFGQSDLGTVLIVADGSESVWGNGDAPSERLAELNQRYKHQYGIPKDFGPCPLQPS